MMDGEKQSVYMKYRNASAVYFIETLQRIIQDAAVTEKENFVDICRKNNYNYNKYV